MFLVAVLVVAILLAAYVFVPAVRSYVDQKLISWGFKKSALDKIDALANDLDSHASVKSSAASAHLLAANAASSEASRASKVSSLLKSA